MIASVVACSAHHTTPNVRVASPPSVFSCGGEVRGRDASDQRGPPQTRMDAYRCKTRHRHPPSAYLPVSISLPACLSACLPATVVGTCPSVCKHCISSSVCACESTDLRRGVCLCECVSCTCCTDVVVSIHSFVQSCCTFSLCLPIHSSKRSQLAKREESSPPGEGPAHTSIKQ